MLQGLYKVISSNPKEVDFKGLASRLSGHEVRDCVSIQKPERSFFNILVRTPSKNTTANQFLRCGTGVLHINASRIGIEERKNQQKKSSENLNAIVREGNDSENAKSLGAYGIGAKQVSSSSYKKVKGRWPSNFILFHTNKCELEGTKKVKPSNGSGKVGAKSGSTKNSMFMQGSSDEFKDPKSKWLVNADGYEEVEDWNCTEECPVKEIDRQSFEGGIHGAGHKANYQWENSYRATSYDMGFGREINRYGDEGGASRFFKSLESESELNTYLNDLIKGTN